MKPLLITLCLVFVCTSNANAVESERAERSMKLIQLLLSIAATQRAEQFSQRRSRNAKDARRVRPVIGAYRRPSTATHKSTPMRLDRDSALASASPNQ